MIEQSICKKYVDGLSLFFFPSQFGADLYASLQVALMQVFIKFEILHNWMFPHILIPP